MEQHISEVWREEEPGLTLHPPEVQIPTDPMEFLSRLSTLEISKSPVRPTLAPEPSLFFGCGRPIPEDSAAGELDEATSIAGNPFSFASSVTSQMVMERILSQSQEVSPLASGRLSHSSGPLNGALTDSPPVSPPENEDLKYCRANNSSKPQYRPGTKTVGRWLKDRKEKKKEEARIHTAQLHAAVSVAGVAAAVAAIAAATAAASAPGKDGQAAKTDMAVAAAATLVAAQCVEAAEAMGVEREQLASVVRSAVNVRTPGDIITLTAAAATALRAATTLKARALKDVWNVAAVIPVEKGVTGNYNGDHNRRRSHEGRSHSDEFVMEEDFLGLCGQEFLARGTELLKRTRKGDLHWKIVSVYINRFGQVMLKMKSRHIGGTITKKKKNEIIEVCKNIEAWPGRHLLEGGDQRRYFGLKTIEKRVIEFECRSQKDFEAWTQGVARLLTIAADKGGTRMQ